MPPTDYRYPLWADGTIPYGLTDLSLYGLTELSLCGLTERRPVAAVLIRISPSGSGGIHSPHGALADEVAAEVERLTSS